MKKHLRTILALALAALMVFGAAACNSKPASTSPENLTFDLSTGKFSFDTVKGAETYVVGVSRVINETTGKALASINGSAALEIGDKTVYIWSEQTGSISGLADPDGDGKVDGQVVFREYSSSATTVGAVKQASALGVGHYIVTAVAAATSELPNPEPSYIEVVKGGSLAEPTGFGYQIEGGQIKITAPSSYYLNCLTDTGMPTKMVFEVKEGSNVIETIELADFSYTNSVNGPNKSFSFNNRTVTGKQTNYDDNKEYTVTVTAVGDGDTVKDASAEATKGAVKDDNGSPGSQGGPDQQGGQPGGDQGQQGGQPDGDQGQQGGQPGGDQGQQGGNTPAGPAATGDITTGDFTLTGGESAFEFSIYSMSFSSNDETFKIVSNYSNEDSALANLAATKTGEGTYTVSDGEGVSGSMTLTGDTATIVLDGGPFTGATYTASLTSAGGNQNPAQPGGDQGQQGGQPGGQEQPGGNEGGSEGGQPGGQEQQGGEQTPPATDLVNDSRISAFTAGASNPFNWGLVCENFDTAAETITLNATRDGEDPIVITATKTGEGKYTTADASEGKGEMTIADGLITVTFTCPPGSFTWTANVLGN